MQTEARKLKEVWRNPNGSFAKGPVVEAPVEQKTEKVEGNTIVAVAMISVVAIAAIVEFWPVSLAVGVIAGAGYGVKKMQAREKLIVNYY